MGTWANSIIRVLLRQYIGETEGREAASHWRGGVYRLYEHKKEKYPVLAHSSEWDSPEAARTFFELYQRVLRAKWKKLEIASSSCGGFGAGDRDRRQWPVFVTFGRRDRPQYRGDSIPGKGAVDCLLCVLPRWLY